MWTFEQNKILKKNVDILKKNVDFRKNNVDFLKKNVDIPKWISRQLFLFLNYFYFFICQKIWQEESHTI